MVYREAVQVQSNHGIPTFHNITEAARAIVERSGIRNGIVSVYSHHTTCCVITQEAAFDCSMTGLETLQMDFVEALERIMPTCRKEGMYQHPGPKARTREAVTIPTRICVRPWLDAAKTSR